MKRAKRLLRAAAKLLAWTVIFVAALVLGVILHLDTPWVRRTVMARTNALLAGTFQGRVEIRKLGGLGLGGVRDVDATVTDQAGDVVLSVQGARVEIDALALLRSALLGDEASPLAIDLHGVSIEVIDVVLDADAHGSLRLVDALQPSAPAAPAAPPTEGSTRPLRFSISDLALAHVHAHGAPGAGPPLDVDLDGLRGGFALRPGGVEASIDDVAVTARAIAAGADVAGELTARVSLPTDPGSPLDAALSWEGAVGGVPSGARVAASGPRSAVIVAAHAMLGSSALDADGNVGWLDDDTRATVAFRAHDVDAHAILRSAPTSRLGLTGDARAHLAADGSLVADTAVLFLGGSVADTPLPPASIHAHLARGTSAANTSAPLEGHADLLVLQTYAVAHAVADLAPRGPTSVLRIRADAAVPEMARVPAVRRAVAGGLLLATRGEVDLDTGHLDGRLRASATNLSAGPVRATTLDLDAEATGSTKALRVTTRLRSPDLPDTDAAAELALAHGYALRGIRVALARAGERATVTAREVTMADGGLTVDDAHVEGLGAPLSATLGLAPSGVRLRASTAGIDLARVARIAHFGGPTLAGTVSLDADLRLAASSGRGRATLDLAHASFASAKDVTGHLDLALNGRALDAKLHAEVARVGTVDVGATKVTVGGAQAIGRGSWTQAFGAVDVDVSADLQRLDALWPGDPPWSEAAGRVLVHAHVARDGVDDVTPDVNLRLDTDHLVLAPSVPTTRDIDGVVVHPPAPWRLAGVDLTLDATIDGDSGALRLQTRLRDLHGDLADVDAATRAFPYATALHDRPQLVSALRTMPVDVHVAIPERELASLPAILTQRLVDGSVRADATLRGTAVHPVASLTASLRHASTSGSGAPFDVDVTGRYDGQRGTVGVQASSRQRRLLDGEARIDAAVERLLEGDASWTASGNAHLTQFPLASIVVLDDRQVAGLLSGDVILERLHEDARASADLSVERLTVAGVAYRSASVKLAAGGRDLNGTVRVEQADGFAEAKVQAAAAWGARVAPELDPSAPLQASLAAHNFRIASLQPFFGASIDELDGRVDATMRVSLDPRDRSARMAGTLGLTRGTLQLAAGGGELHDIAASVRLAPDGTIQLEKLTASGLSGHLEASGVAHLQGTTLRSAKATLTIPRGAAIPVSAGGVEVGDVDGRVELAETTGADGMAHVKVDVPALDVRLPEAQQSTPRSLDAMKGVRIGAHRGNPSRLVLLPLDPVMPDAGGRAEAQGAGIAIEAHLDGVHVVRGTQIRVDLRGDLVVHPGARTTVTGQITLRRGGTLFLQGRTFTVESGTVTFVGDDPSNPQVVVKAGWTAPDATRVYASFTGPLTTGKVTLSSEPALPREEIVQLLLFGSPDGTPAQAPTGAGNSAIATAGGEAAQPLNHMLNQLGLGAITAKVDTSQASNPKPEVEVQIAQALSLQLAVVLGQPLPGTNPDRTLVTIDWRFLSRWSLATTVGDAGTTVFDLLWQHRY